MNKKVISCGSIIVKNGKFLIAKPYQNETWNIPKGKQNDGESFFSTAIRETLEECNIDIRKYVVESLGQFSYLKNKNLYLYLVVVDTIPKLKCNSFFIDVKKNRRVPEMVKFKWIKFDDYKKYFSPSLSKVFDRIIPLIKSKVK